MRPRPRVEFAIIFFKYSTLHSTNAARLSSKLSSHAAMQWRHSSSDVTVAAEEVVYVGYVHSCRDKEKQGRLDSSYAFVVSWIYFVYRSWCCSESSLRPPPSAVNVTLVAFVATWVCCWAPARLQQVRGAGARRYRSIDLLPAARALSSKLAAHCYCCRSIRRTDGRTDKQTDARPFHGPFSAYDVSAGLYLSNSIRGVEVLAIEVDDRANA